jgi:hypothetical protein
VGIDTQTFDEILMARLKFAGEEIRLSAAILGDCAFTTNWATGDNRRDLAEFACRLNLARVETIDLAGNPTIKADITQPLPENLCAAFDMVFDIGTLYWIFDVGAAWRHLFQLLKPRGLIANYSALTGYFGRGYYNFHPRLFEELYAANGFDKVIVKVRIRKSFEEWSLRRALFSRLHRPSKEFVTLSKGEIFLNDASWRQLKFRDKLYREATILPNDADVFCVATREMSLPFSIPTLSIG